MFDLTPYRDRRVTDLAGTVGKTVASAHDDGDATVALIVFTDGTFLYAHARPRWGETADIGYDSPDAYSWLFVEAGIVTREEVEALNEAERERCARARAASDREQYERLKAKFEGPAVAPFG